MNNDTIIQNYRDAYVTRFNEECSLTNEEVLEIIREVGTLRTSEETDEAVLDEMFADNTTD